MIEVFIKIRLSDGKELTKRKLMPHQVFKDYEKQVGTTDHNGITLLELWQIK